MALIQEMLEAGWALVPIPAASKGPTTPGWNRRENVITSVENADRLSENIGLAHAYCKQPTAVLDIDDLELARQWLDERHIDLEVLLNADDAVQICSGREGRAKLLYELPPGARPLLTKKIVDPQSKTTVLEFRCASSSGTTVQDILPPSIHPYTGQPYRWGGKGNPLTPPVIPQALLDAWPLERSGVDDTTQTETKTTATVVVLEPQSAQHLRSALLSMRSDDREFWVKCGLALHELGDVGRGLWLEWSVTSEKYEANDAARVWDSLNPTGIGHKFIFAEAQRRGWVNPAKAFSPPTTDTVTGEVWPTPEPLPPSLLDILPFDSSLLPARLRAGVVDIAERLNCPIEYVAVPMLISAGVAVGNRIGILPKRFDTSWEVYPALWGGIIGPPGSMKTPAQLETMKGLRDLEQQAAQAYASALNRYQQDVRLFEKQKKEFDNGKGPWPTEPTRPPKIRYLVNDVTYQALGVILADNPSGVLAHADELSGLLRTLDSPGQEGARGFFLAGWGGRGSHTFDRITRGSVVLNNYTLSIFGGFQPDRIKHYVQGASNGQSTNDGLLQRFQLLVWPDPVKSIEVVDRVPDKAALTEMHGAIYYLKGLANKGLNTEARSSFGASLLHFNDDAKELYDRWYALNEKSLRSGKLSEAEQSHFAKYRSLIPGLALLCHLIERHEGDVCLDCTEKALGLGRVFKSHAKRTYASIYAHDQEPAKELARRLIAGDLSNGFSARTVYMKHWRGLAKPQVEQALEQLAERGWVAELVVQTGTKPKVIYTINPGIHEGLL